jgi:hypothetical protein
VKTGPVGNAVWTLLIVSEQRLLLGALDEGTDEELAETLYTSVSAVTRMWHSIYDRVGLCLPGY